MALVLPVILCLASGILLVSLGWPRRVLLPANLLLQGSLSIGFGLGLFSVVFFVCRACDVMNLVVVDCAVVALLVAGLAVRSRMSTNKRTAVAASGGEAPLWFQQALTTAFAIALLDALYSAIRRMQIFRHGDGWDAFAIWNFHARFLFRGGDHWRDGFSVLAGGSHPDYPLLLPAAIAHFWTYLGRDDPGIPGVIGVVFTFATVGVLFGALAVLRGRVQAMVGSIALLATPYFIEQGTAQYADVPLGFFFLATVVLLCLSDGRPAQFNSPGRLVLTGLAAGFAAWTKNEGLLFLCAVAVSTFLIHVCWQGQVHPANSRLIAVAPLLAGLVPGVFLIAYFKHSIAAPGDLFSDPRSALHKLLDPSRYWAVWAGYVKGFFRFGHWFWIPGTLLLVGLYVGLGKDERFARQSGFRTSVVTLMVTLAGYFAVFVITPYDVHWHLRFSLVRLFLQLWPSVVFLSFLTVRVSPNLQL